MRAAAIVLGCSVLVSASQAPATPPAPDVEQVVTRFLETADHYLQTFKNLTTEETRLNEEFREDGRLRRKREIVADLVVYVSARAPDAPVEYRDAKTVDGKPIDRRDRRTFDLITRAMKTGSADEELRLINRESLRYDFDLHVAGLTIGQFFNRKRPDFRFEWAGREQVDGHDTLVVAYRQIVPTPEHSGVTRMYRGMGVTSFFSRGRLWLDASTFQLRRHRNELAGMHPGLPEPALLMSTDHDYTDSRFGILTPSRIVFEAFTQRGPKSKPAFTLTARMTFTYGAFRRFEVATEQTIAAPK